MVRGVNKNIIEVTDTGNECFERAILFVREDQAGGDSAHLQQRARVWLQGLRLRRGMLGRGWLWLLVRYGLCVSAGAALMFALLKM